MVKENINILIVDDDEDILFSARMLLKQYYQIVRIEKNPENIPSILEAEQYDVILLDMNFSGDSSEGKEGFNWLKKILEINPSSVVILITAFGTIEMAVKAIKEGATDFVLKPWQNEKLLATVSSAVKLSQSHKEVVSLSIKQKQLNEDLDQKFQEIIGISTTMLPVFDTIQKVAGTEANVLIFGENGTGKELIARAIHRKSKRCNEIFLSVDMGAISESLFESELFGYIKGAFTDAKEDRAGRFEVASGGTLFLDEIGNLPVNLQVKLLTVLQNRKVTRVGSSKAIDIDIRLICATNIPLDELISEKKFRQDLLYRINTVEIKIPPLRERPEDIQLLAEYYLKVYSKKYNKQLKLISQPALKKLEQHNWPGNVRELQHVIERIVILSESEIIKPDDFYLSRPEIKDNTFPINSFHLEEAEKTLIIKAINKHSGNLTKAAKELGLTRTSLYRRLEKYGL